jgi:hypothetical protein
MDCRDGRPVIITDVSCKKAITFYFIFAHRYHGPGRISTHCVLLNSQCICVSESYTSMNSVSVLVIGLHGP